MLAKILSWYLVRVMITFWRHAHRHAGALYQLLCSREQPVAITTLFQFSKQRPLAKPAFLNLTFLHWVIKNKIKIDFSCLHDRYHYPVYPLLGCCDHRVLTDNRGPAWTTELISKLVRFFLGHSLAFFNVIYGRGSVVLFCVLLWASDFARIAMHKKGHFST